MGRVHGHGWGRAGDGYYSPGDRSHPIARELKPAMPNLSVRWDQEEARGALRRQILQLMAHADAVLVLLEAAFVKHSGAYVGAQRHLAEDEDDAGGRAEHCQTGVFLCYSGPLGEGYLDRDLFLPRPWTEREGLRLASGLPADVTYSTRPQMARRMLERAFAAGVPHRFIAGASTFGCDAGLRLWLEQRGEAYVLGIPPRESLRTGGLTARAGSIVALWPDEAWRTSPSEVDGRVSYRWAGLPLRQARREGWERWLLARRLDGDADRTECYIAFVPRETGMQAMIGAVSACDRAKRCMDDARRTVGLDRFSGKSWEAWYRHMTVALLAHGIRCALRRDGIGARADWVAG